jgi:hypothetical protein
MGVGVVLLVATRRLKLGSVASVGRV